MLIAVELAIAVLIFVLLIFLVLQVLVSRGFRARALRLAARVRAGKPPSDMLDKLPRLMAEHALRSGVKPGAAGRSVTFTQTAQLRLKPGTPMRTFAAWQIIATGEPGFLWEARQTAGSLIGVRVIDAFAEHQGLIEARALGLFPVVRSASKEVSLAEAFRYLAELPWAPDAIVGNPELRWRDLGDRRVEAALTVPAGEAVVSFDFDARGDIVSIQAKGRPATDANGKTVRYDWIGRFGEYTQFGPRRVPVTAEIGYVYPTGFEVYFSARIADYHVAA